MMVVIFHCGLPRHSIVYKDFDWTWILTPNGLEAVWIFFVISGYLMGKAFYTERYSCDSAGIGSFWRNRILRVAPLYYFATLILTIFVYPSLLKIENWGFLLRVLIFSYDHGPESTSAIQNPWGNGAFWSLSTEMQFYILVPFLFSFCFTKINSYKRLYSISIFVFLMMLLLRLGVWVIFRNQITESQNFQFYINYSYAPMFMNLDLFMAGFLLNAWFKLREKFDSQSLDLNTNDPQPQKSIYGRLNFNKYKRVMALVLLLCLNLFISYHWYHQELRPGFTGGIRTSTTFFILQPLTALVVCFFIWAFESDTYRNFTKNASLSLNSILKNPLRSLEVIGVLSYGIYIWHMPIIASTGPIYTSAIPFEAYYRAVTATLILSSLLAAVTYYLVELPFAKLKIFK